MSTSVAIVGAGAAGLSAAHTLMRRGVDVTVYESLDRIGGRIHTATGFASYPVELGAETVNGYRHRVRRWARRQSLKLIRPPDHMREYFASDGGLLDDSTYKALPVSREVNALWRRMLTHRGDDLTVEEFLEREGASPKAVAVVRHHAAEIARDLGTLSVIGMRELVIQGERTEEQTARMRVPYLSAFGHIIKALGERIHTATPVQRVETSETGVRIAFGGDREERFDRAIITVPLGVLKKHGIEFAPRLPAEKLQAIERLDFTPGLKVSLRFARRFWPEDLDYLAGLPCGILWPPQGARDSGEPVLINYAVGIHAEHLRAGTDPPAVQVIAALDTLFGGQASERLVDSMTMDWTDVPSIGGYFTSPTSEWYLRDKAALAEPVDGTIFFAGEATNTDHASMGYVHGAAETGHRAAKEVLRSL